MAPDDRTTLAAQAAQPLEASPVEFIATDDPSERPAPGVGLCLSGGGYRAMLFHLGALWRLNEAAYLKRIDRISSVSGGSIAAGMLASAWERLDFHEGVARRLVEEVVQPVRRLASKTIDVKAIVLGLLLPGDAADRAAAEYRRYLFQDTTLQDIPDTPRFVFNAANVQSGALWRFMKPYMRDYKVGEVKSPKVRLAVAVAASAAFPPVLSPLVLSLSPSDFTPGSGGKLGVEPYTRKVVLTDGGVYDNLGLETVWKRLGTVLVSDGGGVVPPEGNPPRDWFRHLYRVIGLIHGQVGSLRKRTLIASFARGDREGAYWGITTDIAHYGLADALDCPEERTRLLADVPTRLRRMNDRRQEQLINWGYAVCDAAIRKHLDPTLHPPSGFPYPGTGIG